MPGTIPVPHVKQNQGITSRMLPLEFPGNTPHSFPCNLGIASNLSSLTKKFFLFLIIYNLLSSLVYARGKADAKAEKEPQNPDWVLAVTAFDVSALPPSWQIIGDIITRNLVNTLNTLHYRIRVYPEYTFYETYAWSKNQTEAAKTLATKREDRDKLLFQGNPSWKYQKSLKALEEEIQKLEESLRVVERTPPGIASEPVFKFTEDNNTGVFPSPPKEGGEYRFCVTQKADAFLTGSISEFHGRVYVSLQLYTRYTQSFQYEDRVIFSIEDTQQGIDTLADRLVVAVSGAPSSSILIHGDPKEAIILIDGSFAGRREVGPKELPHGSVEIESFMDNYQALTMPLELQPGELAELYINLQPLSREALIITVPDESAQVYQGALYLGQTPLPVDVPTEKNAFFHAETLDGKTGSVIKRGRSFAGSLETENTLNLPASIPHTAAEERVAKARRRFYGALGRFWIALPTAFVLQGISSVQIRAYNSSGDPSLYQPAQNLYYISIGAWVVFGIVSADVFFRTFMYIYTSRKDADPLVRSSSIQTPDVKPK